MSDLIDRQAAIDAVGNMLRRKFGIGGDLAEITITGLPSAQPEQQWIPITERLPDKAGVYLVNTNGNNVYLWYYKLDNIIDWRRLIKAWMFVPAPYQE